MRQYTLKERVRSVKPALKCSLGSLPRWRTILYKRTMCQVVAQFGRALGLDPRGPYGKRRFKSCRPDTLFLPAIGSLVDPLVWGQMQGGSIPPSQTILSVLSSVW